MTEAILNQNNINTNLEEVSDKMFGPALIFSGQGAQEKEMGKDLAETDPESMELWKEADKASQLPLREIFWDGDESDQSDTRALQPALTVVNCNLWNNLTKRHKIEPVACAGHSLGEFSALVAAGVINPIEAIQATALRGKLMAEADPEHKGSMAAILRLDEELVNKLVQEAKKETNLPVVAANFNTPAQTVISGIREAVNLVCAKAKALKGRAIELKVSGAFHTPLMNEPNAEFQKFLNQLNWRDPTFPVYSNSTAKAAQSGTEVKKGILNQMVSPVYWVNTMRNLYLNGVRWWMEISPRAVLGKMVGPSMAGIAGQCDSLRVDLINSLSGILNYVP